jgi:enediyne biosynthesis protein E3
VVKDDHTYNRLKTVGISFLAGYHAALENQLVSLDDQLYILNDLYKGFAYEGAAMALALKDFLSLRGNRFEKFIENEGEPHLYMAYVGAGWALARCPQINYKRFLSKLDPLLKWLVIDGFGFHDGYFQPGKAFYQQKVPKKFLGSYAERAYTQGLGRSMWFYTAGDVEAITRLINIFPEKRRADLWSGIGLACAYAGGGSDSVYSELKESSRNYLPELAQGVAFACKARIRASLITTHTEKAATVICNASSKEAARITDMAMHELEGNRGLYENWRLNIQNKLMGKGSNHGIL